MNKIKYVCEKIVFIIIFCFVIALAIPGLREGFYNLWLIIWTVIKQFFLKDIVKTLLIYFLLASVVTVIGETITRKTENKLWRYTAIILDIIGLLGAIGINII